MDVVLGHERQVEVDDERKLRDVETSCGNVSHHKHPDAAGLEIGEATGPLRLALPPVNHGGLHVRALEQVADTIGAGDTFTAGILTWLSRANRLSKPAIAALDRESVIAALKFAVKAAAVTVSRPGADPPWAHELEG